MLYFVPTRVANEFKRIRLNNRNLTMPIIKRKLTAMIRATKWRRELINEENQIYKHEFNGIVMVVEENKRCVSRVRSNPLSRKDDSRSSSYYVKICKQLGLNSNRNNFKKYA